MECKKTCRRRADSQILYTCIHHHLRSIRHAFVAASLFAERLATIGTNLNLIADNSATFGDSPYHLAIFRVSPYALRMDVRVLKEGFDKFGSTSPSLKRLDKMASR